MSTDLPTPSWTALRELAAAALSARCPRCGKGALFDGHLAFVDECAVCGLQIAKNDSGDGPAVFLVFLLGFTVVPAALWWAFVVNWPLWLHVLLWGGVLVGITVGLLRPAKAMVIALQYRNRPHDFDAADG